MPGETLGVKVIPIMPRKFDCHVISFRPAAGLSRMIEDYGIYWV
jgi:hypothetical protein